MYVERVVRLAVEKRTGPWYSEKLRDIIARLSLRTEGSQTDRHECKEGYSDAHDYIGYSADNRALNASSVRGLARPGPQGQSHQSTADCLSADHNGCHWLQ